MTDQEHTEQPSLPEDNPTTSPTITTNDNNNNDEIIVDNEEDDETDEEFKNKTHEELLKLYDDYNDKFRHAYRKSVELFESEQNSRITMSYYHRRNQALLDLLSQFEQQQSPKAEEEELGKRLEGLVGRVPRVEKCIVPLLELIKDGKVDKSELIHLYMLEKIPDLVNDDISKFVKNPQDIVNWNLRNQSNGNLLIDGGYKPITVDCFQEYNGSDYLLNLNDDFVSNQSNAATSTGNGSSVTGGGNASSTSSASSNATKKKTVKKSK
ncbi:hypothetical protein SBY92_003760 [Candida maltosa Xu316]|uniref:Uncharacterized protein n=1 Tax=Candida maltosa (strain Xu316) TaxID=1245528 RepID=M3HRF7_CANMX|nr:hypothetical protein G210_4912 [Candida maltosa Xu316]